MSQKALLIIMSITLWATTVKAQTAETKRHEVSINFGLLPFTWRDEDEENGTTLFTAQYMYQPVKRLGIGAVAGFRRTRNNARHHINEATTMMAVQGNWINRPAFKLYSKLAIGGMYSTDLKWETAVQYSLIGSSFNLGKGLFGLAELGIGSQGLLIVGIGYRI